VAAADGRSLRAAGACANIANLLLARGLKDRHQTAIRALSALSRGRLVRKAFTESLTLSGSAPLRESPLRMLAPA